MPGTGVTIDTPRLAKVDRRVGYHGVLGHQIGLGRIRQPAYDRVGRLLGILGMAGEAPLIVGVTDRLRRAEIRRRLEIMRMMALRTIKSLGMVGEVHGALEFSLYPREVVRFVLLGVRTFPWMTFHHPRIVLPKWGKMSKPLTWHSWQASLPCSAAR